MIKHSQLSPEMPGHFGRIAQLKSTVLGWGGWRVAIPVLPNLNPQPMERNPRPKVQNVVEKLWEASLSTSGFRRNFYSSIDDTLWISMRAAFQEESPHGKDRDVSPEACMAKHKFCHMKNMSVYRKFFHVHWQFFGHLSCRFIKGTIWDRLKWVDSLRISSRTSKKWCLEMLQELWVEWLGASLISKDMATPFTPNDAVLFGISALVNLQQSRGHG